MEVALATKVLGMLLESEEDEALAGAAGPLVELRRLGIIRKYECLGQHWEQSVHGPGKDSGSGEAGSRDTQIVAISAMLQMKTSMRRAGGDGADRG